MILTVIKIFMYLLTLGWMVFEDIRITKSPFDKKNRKFKLRTHWWNKRWDDVIPRMIAGTIGAILASYGGAYLMAEVMNWPFILEAGTEVVAVFVLTLSGERIIKKIRER